ncbi:MAG: PBECR2 nuclease fold domain-containing protein [Acidaminococcaceae bacterium]
MIEVGGISIKVIKALGLTISANTPIYLGDSNIKHMKSRHPQDYAKYSAKITNILAQPDYVALNADGSLEYVKEFQIDNKYIKVAVRISTGGQYFARSLYSLNNNRVANFIKKGTLKPI